MQARAVYGIGSGDFQYTLVCVTVRYPIPLKGMGLRTVGRFSRGCRKPEPDQAQPGHIVWIQSGEPSGYVTEEIGTSGRLLNPLLCGAGLNRQTGFEPVFCTSNLRITLPRGAGEQSPRHT